MKEIKTAVGQDNPVSRGAPLPDLLCQFGGRKNFLGGLRQSVLRDGAQKFRAGYSGRAAFHHHNATGVVGEPRCRFRISPRG
jgi:hypothetical protein